MRFVLLLAMLCLSPNAWSSTTRNEQSIIAKWTGENICALGVDRFYSISEVELREKFFSVPQDAVKEFVIGADGQVMHVIYRENLICAGETMNMYCGSGGCSRDFVINHDIYEIFGGKPSLVYANGTPVILVGRSGANCNTGPNSAACFQAFVWDQSTQKFNTFGGHKKPVR